MTTKLYIDENNDLNDLTASTKKLIIHFCEDESLCHCEGDCLDYNPPNYVCSEDCEGDCDGCVYYQNFRPCGEHIKSKQEYLNQSNDFSNKLSEKHHLLTSLEELFFYNYANLTDEIVFMLAKPTLRHIIFAETVGITEKSMKYISENCPNLESLSIRYKKDLIWYKKVYQINSDFAKYISQMTNLKELSIAMCDFNLNEFLENLDCQSLTQLQLLSVGFNNKSLELLSKLKNLKYIDISDSSFWFCNNKNISMLKSVEIINFLESNKNIISFKHNNKNTELLSYITSRCKDIKMSFKYIN